MKKYFFISAAILFSSSVFSQLDSKYEIGLNAGMGIYFGDLTPNPLGSYRTIQPALGLQGTRILNNAFAVRLNLMHTRLKGDDSKYENPEWRQYRNFKFTSPVTEISGLLVWNILGRNLNEAGIFNFSPYLMAGGGYSFINVKNDWSETDLSHFSTTLGIEQGLNEDETHGPPRGMAVVPLGAGLRLGISSRFSFAVESIYRITFTDYLDGFSQAANPDMKDSYQTHTVGVIYTFRQKNKELDCPVVMR